MRWTYWSIDSDIWNRGDSHRIQLVDIGEHVIYSGIITTLNREYTSCFSLGLHLLAIYSFTMDVFMMIRRQKLTLFIDTKETSTVLEVKKMIEGITKVPANNIRLIIDSNKQPMDDDNQTLADCGLTSVMAKAYSPVSLYLCYRKTTGGNENDWEPIDVAEL